MLVAALAVLSMIAGGGPTAAPTLQTLRGEVVPPLRRTTILLFWRPDCGPCLVELADLAALHRAAAPADLKLVGLQSPVELETGLRKRGLGPADSLTTPEEPAALLTRLGGAPPRLPLAVAFRPDGAVCAAHNGLVGRDRVRDWARQCGARDAAR